MSFSRCCDGKSVTGGSEPWRVAAPQALVTSRGERGWAIGAKKAPGTGAFTYIFNILRI